VQDHDFDAYEKFRMDSSKLLDQLQTSIVTFLMFDRDFVARTVAQISAENGVEDASSLSLDQIDQYLKTQSRDART
jgi:hypothetical protein